MLCTKLVIIRRNDDDSIPFWVSILMNTTHTELNSSRRCAELELEFYSFNTES